VVLSLTLVPICAGHVGRLWYPLGPLSSWELGLGPQESSEGRSMEARLMGRHLGRPWRGCSAFLVMRRRRATLWWEVQRWAH